MKRNEIKILVVEDDTTQGRALQEGLKRSGFQVFWVSNPDEAALSADKNDYDVLVVDCLLPKTNGVELAFNMRKRIGEELVIILMSGIYKDKNFTRDALSRTNATAFFSKPLEIEKVIAAIEDGLAEMLEPDMPPLLESLTLKELNMGHRMAALTEGQSLHGFDLPLLYSLLFGSGLTGKLQIMASDGSASALSFRDGTLTHVHLQDKTSYFGALLVEMGFTSNAEVQEALQLESSRPIGERLVASHSLSPHAIRIVRQEQMIIRLSRTVQDQFVDVNFVQCDVEASDEAINRERFTQLAWDWICSKINQTWIQDFYSRWLEYQVEFADPGFIKRRLGAIPGLENMPKVMASLTQYPVLSQAIEGSQLAEEDMLPLLHLLMLEKAAWFGSKRASQLDTKRSLGRLQKLIADGKNKDHFQLMGISPNSGDKEINRAYMDLAKVFHPDRLGPGTLKELRQLTEQYFAMVVAAHDVLKDPQKRAVYLRELAEGSAEKVLQTESLFEQGMNYLRRGKFNSALEVFAGLAAQRQHRADLTIYLAWAKLKVGAPEEKMPDLLNAVGELVNRVPPEERHSAHYFYTKGLYYYNVGDFEKAKTNFKHALMMEPKMVEARRDLSVTRSRLNQVENTRTDFSTVVTRLLGGKKKKSG